MLVGNSPVDKQKVKSNPTRILCYSSKGEWFSVDWNVVPLSKLGEFKNWTEVSITIIVNHTSHPRMQRYCKPLWSTSRCSTSVQWTKNTEQVSLFVLRSEHRHKTHFLLPFFINGFVSSWIKNGFVPLRLKKFHIVALLQCHMGDKRSGLV